MENTTSSKHSSGTYWFHQHSDRSFSHQQERQHFWSFIHSSAAWWAWCPRCLNIWGKQGLLSLAGRPFCPHPGCQQSSATLHIDKSRDNPGCQERYSLGCPPRLSHLVKYILLTSHSTVTQTYSQQQMACAVPRAWKRTPWLALLMWLTHFSCTAEHYHDTELRKSA